MQFQSKGLFALTISFGTTAYHFVIRLVSCLIIDSIFHNNIDYHRWWFDEKPFEKALYKRLNVRNWKRKIPAYNPAYFNMSRHSAKELIGATCEAEIVHELIVVLSFVPLLFSIYFDSFAVFMLTSIGAAAVDLVFVIVQRYNRPRFIKLMNKLNDNRKRQSQSDCL